ncbi:hypothetical protein [Luteolibacter soli]|uniref:Uncharacterized protein n=1 Tax=Luteolibacter soli TaxID=3135280 RepID=A0ABU9AWX7_9BACT
MNSTPSLATSSSSLDQALAEIEGMARGAMAAEGARGWWHAARIVRLFGDAGRAMRQQAQHAKYHAERSPEKAAAYRGAMVIVARHSGEALADFDRADGDRADAACERRPGSAARQIKMKKRGPGWMGWMGVEREDATAGVVGVAGAFPAFSPSHPSRSCLPRPDPFPSVFIPFIGG